MKKNIFTCENKTAVVFGGSGLIGFQVTKALAEAGACVVNVDLKSPRDEACLQEMPVSFLKSDLTSENEINSVLKKIIEQHKQIHIFVNCSYPRSDDWGVKFEKVPFASVTTNLVNQLGTCFLSCQIVAEHMKEFRQGAIVNVGSTYGVVGPDFSIYEGTSMTSPAAYSAIKGGVINFTRYLATYYGRLGLRVNCVSPGGIFDAQPASFVEKYSHKTPLGRMGRPEEIAAAVLFLASDAASYVTGHNLMADGGWTAW